MSISDWLRRLRLSTITLGSTCCLILFGVSTSSFAKGNVEFNATDRGVQACQVDAKGSGRDIVNAFLVEPVFANDRVQTGTAGLDTTEVRLLADPADTLECIQLNTDFGWTDPQARPERWMYFRSNRGHIFLVYILPPPPPGEIWLRQTPMLVLDSTYNLLGAYGM